MHHGFDIGAAVGHGTQHGGQRRLAATGICKLFFEIVRHDAPTPDAFDTLDRSPVVGLCQHTPRTIDMSWHKRRPPPFGVSTCRGVAPLCSHTPSPSDIGHELNGSGEDRVEHGLGEAFGERVLLTRVERAEQT